jgi:hypothetical protein
VNPILFALLLVVGCCFLWLAYVFYAYAEDLREAAPLSVPLAIIGVTVLTAAGLGMGGVLA